MLYRLIKDEDFSKLKIGKRLVFNKEAMMAYLSNKYGSLSKI